MPRTLKRRSDAISRDEELSDPLTGPSTRPEALRRRQSVSSDDDASDANSPMGSDAGDETQEGSNTQSANVQNLTKKLIRLALSSEYARLPLRRSDISQKIFKESNASPRLFKQVFDSAQKSLDLIFGMQLMELPVREKTTLKDRRTQATQGTSKSQSSSSSSVKSWILVSTLPTAYKTHPLITQPTFAPSKESEASYTALYTFILALIFMNNSSLPEAKLERYLKRVNADNYTPYGTLEKLLGRMIKEGYIEKRRDTTSGEEVVEFAPGPRGKVEVGVNGVAGLVRSVYGFGSVSLDGSHVDSAQQVDNGGTNGNEGEERDGEETLGPPGIKIDRDDLEQRLKRSLGVGVISNERRSADATTSAAPPGENDMEVEQPKQNTRPRTSRRGRPQRNQDDDDDDEEEDDDDDNNNDNDDADDD